MPEGDTVWRTAYHLREALVGETLTRTDFRVPAYATLDLSGRRVDESLSRGKHLLLRVGDRTIHTHLRMEGAWHVYGPADRWRRPAYQARLVLETPTRQAVGFDLGVVEVLDREDEEDALGYLGPDVLDPSFDREEAVDRLAADGDVGVFVALHDQRNLAGLGNEYITELCFASGLAPTRPVAELDRSTLGAVVDRGRRMILANRDRVERTFTGDTRPGRRTWVYGREGQPCRRCGERVLRSELGPDPVRARVVYWCPRCQP